MEKNLKFDTVVPTATLVDMEGYVVDFAGIKTHAPGVAKGVV